MPANLVNTGVEPVDLQVLANPRAGKGRGPGEAERALGQMGLAAAWFLTEGPGHAQALAASSLRPDLPVLIVGGDGTLHEVVNGLMQRPREERPPIAVLAGGTGCDFARSVGVYGRDLEGWWRDRIESRIDVGRLDLEGASPHYFLNECSVGLGAEVVQRVGSASKAFGSRLAFGAGTLRALAHHEAQSYELGIEDGVEEGRYSLIVIANGEFFGGGMHIAPGARLDDGQLNVVAVRPLGATRFLRHAGDLYRGAHMNLPFVQAWTSDAIELRILGGRGLALEADGEAIDAMRDARVLGASVARESLVLLGPDSRSG